MVGMDRRKLFALGERLLYPFVVPAFWLWRWIVNCMSPPVRKHVSRLPTAERYFFYASLPIANVLFLVIRGMRYALRVWNRAFTDYALEKYTHFMIRHYAADGMSYSYVSNKTDDELLEILNSSDESRYAFYLDRYDDVLQYRDGHAFLDLGCGGGEETMMFMERYTNSQINGIELNPNAVRSIQIGARGQKRVNVQVGDLRDLETLRAWETGSIDHVTLLHVIPYLYAGGTAETTAYRQALVDECVRIARRSVAIFKDHFDQPRDMSLEIGRNYVALLHDDIPSYFRKHLGQGQLMVLIGSPKGDVLLYKKTTV